MNSQGIPYNNAQHNIMNTENLSLIRFVPGRGQRDSNSQQQQAVIEEEEIVTLRDETRDSYSLCTFPGRTKNCQKHFDMGSFSVCARCFLINSRRITLPLLLDEDRRARKVVYPYISRPPRRRSSFVQPVSTKCRKT